jgi:hypothetical protein
MTGAEVTKLIEDCELPVEKLAILLEVPESILKNWMLAGIPEVYSSIFVAGLNWVVFNEIRPSDEEIQETYRKVDEALAESAARRGEVYVPPVREI